MSDSQAQKTISAAPDQDIVQRSKQSVDYNRPGPVQPKATIRLHTYIAHQLMFGRQSTNKQFRDQCFVLFAANLNALWTCSKSDDPYADAKLIQIEEKMSDIRTGLTDLNEGLDSLLDSMKDSGISADSHASVRPVDVPIAFRAVHAAVAIQLLGTTDSIIQKALMARHFGLVTSQDWQRILAKTSTPLRSLFELSRFRASGATRDDLAANNARARAAIEKFGTLPEDILQGIRIPELGPRPTRSLLFAENAGQEEEIDDSLVSQSLMALESSLATPDSEEAKPVSTKGTKSDKVAPTPETAESEAESAQ